MIHRSFLLIGSALSLALAGCASSGTYHPRGINTGERLPNSGAVDPAFFRAGEGPEHVNIFSPLNLPTPTAVRTASGEPGPRYWQQRADYVIEASLEAGNILNGKETVTYTNYSPQSLDYIWVHLEQNIMRSESLGALSSEPDTRFGHHGFEGGVDLKSVRLGGAGGEGEELKVSVYDTVARIDLPRPLAPGEKLTFQCVWSFRVPEYGTDRMGVQHVKDGDIFEIAQWYPAVAVYDDVHGWNTLPYLGQGEFYTNFGDFDVKLSVPRSHVVASTGVLQNPEEVLTETERDRLAKARESETPVMIVEEADIGKPEARPAGDGPLSWHFKAEHVRSFAWASSPAYMWDGCFLKSAGPDVPDHPDQAQGTLCMSVYPREALPLWKEKATDDLRFSIEHYSARWHRYPYPVATNVNGIVGGMEYPMLIMCSQRQDEKGLFGVTTHEIGHNWFPMLVNTDERRHAWMDEGFNTFINVYSTKARYPDEKAQVRRTDIAEFARQMGRGQQQPMDIAADQVWRGRLGYLEYAKTATALVLLREEVLGPERFDFAFRHYIDLWAFKSPRPADFYRSMEDAAGMDLAWFWRGWMLGTGTLDQAVTEVRYDKSGRPLVVFENKGELVMPLAFRVTFEDGSTQDRKLPVEVWFTTNQWTATWDAAGKKITKVEVDPEGKMPDVDRGNNVWAGKP